MGRSLRTSLGGYVYHVLNRGNGRATIFRKDADYESFERVMVQALEHVPGMRLLAYALMPNHWHLVLWPRADGELSDFMHYLTLTHTQRWHAHYKNVGGGHVYQGRYKSFPVADDDHYLRVCRYVERNALRAKLVTRAQDWPWGSLSRRRDKNQDGRPSMSDGPLYMPAGWQAHVNKPQMEQELEVLRRCVQRGQPYGGDAWVKRTAQKLGLTTTLRAVGRPRKSGPKDENGS